MSAILLPPEREALIAKLKASAARGKLTVQTAGNYLSRAKVIDMADRVAMLSAAGLTIEQARHMGGQFSS